jgi:hypothetical protein
VPTRRQFLKVGIVGAIALGAVRVAYGPFSGRDVPPPDDHPFAFLSPTDRAIVAAVAPVILDGGLPAEAVEQVVRGVDVAIAGLPLQVQSEIAQLFALLGLPLTRRFIAGVWSNWQDAHPADIAVFLQRWRFSPIATLRSAYQALHRLVAASWYGNTASWQAIGYPGPPSLGTYGRSS